MRERQVVRVGTRGHVLGLGSVGVIRSGGRLRTLPRKGLLVGAVGTRSCGATLGSAFFTRTLVGKSTLVPSKTDVIVTYQGLGTGDRPARHVTK